MPRSSCHQSERTSQTFKSCLDEFLRRFRASGFEVASWWSSQGPSYWDCGHTAKISWSGSRARPWSCTWSWGCSRREGSSSTQPKSYRSWWWGRPKHPRSGWTRLHQSAWARCKKYALGLCHRWCLRSPPSTSSWPRNTKPWYRDQMCHNRRKVPGIARLTQGPLPWSRRRQRDSNWCGRRTGQRLQWKRYVRLHCSTASSCWTAKRRRSAIWAAWIAWRDATNESACRAYRFLRNAARNWRWSLLSALNRVAKWIWHQSRTRTWGSPWLSLPCSSQSIEFWGQSWPWRM